MALLKHENKQTKRVLTSSKRRTLGNPEHQPTYDEQGDVFSRNVLFRLVYMNNKEQIILGEKNGRDTCKDLYILKLLDLHQEKMNVYGEWTASPSTPHQLSGLLEAATGN